MRFPRYELRGPASGWPAPAIALVILTAVAGCNGDAEPEPVIGGTSQPATVDQPVSPGSSPAAAQTSPVPRTSPAPPPNPVVTGEAAAGLGVPWAMARLPDGGTLVTERDTAEVKLIAGGQVTTLGVIQDALEAGGEGGLLGVAVGPEFEADARVFLYYTSSEDNRVVSVTYTDGALGDPEPVITGIPKANIHNGGRIRFGPDGYLYIGTGDASNRDSAQDPESLGGKILRLTPDGDPAPGNPFGNAVYSLGHRNVQGLAWDSAGGLWASEFGPDRDDELNLITPGGNYGWPAVTGAPGNTEYTDARVVWPSTATSSPSGLAIVGDVAYVGGLRGERLWQVPLGAETVGKPVSHFEGAYGRLRETIAVADDELWVATNEGANSRILRVEVQ